MEQTNPFIIVNSWTSTTISANLDYKKLPKNVNQESRPPPLSQWEVKEVNLKGKNQITALMKFSTHKAKERELKRVNNIVGRPDQTNTRGSLQITRKNCHVHYK